MNETVKAAATVAGASALQEQLTRERLAKEYDARAAAYQRAADAQPYAINEYKSIMKAKAQECRNRARELRGQLGEAR
jgi:hypothetical protein